MRADPVPQEQSAGNRDLVNIVDHGAIGDGDPAHAARNAAAIRAAIAAALVLGFREPPLATAAEIFVPPGVFVVEARAIAWIGAAVSGRKIRGAGWSTSLLRLAGAGWMFDNAGGHNAGERLAFPIFTGLGFEGCLPAAYVRRAIPQGGPNEG